jgi:peroxiredoxin
MADSQAADPEDPAPGRAAQTPSAGRAGGGGWLLAIAIAAMAGAVVLLGEGGPAPVRRGDPAPAFELPRLGGEGLLALDELRGQVVLVNFWATWCKPCEDEMPAMERLYQAMRPRGFELVAISVDEQPELVGPFARRMGLSFPILLDEDQTTSRAYQTMGYPESFLVDRNGTIIERYIGPKPWDEAGYVDRIARLIDAP